MSTSPEIAWQPSLLDETGVSFDSSFSSLERVQLDPTSWVDHAPGWVTGSDRLFAEVLEGRDWKQRERHMFDRKVREPRLTAPWIAASGEPLEPHVIEDMRAALSERYGVEFDSVGFNLYRDGQDGVAWHADKIRKEIEEPIVILASLGEPRRFLMRPKGGGKSRPFQLGRGDLLVTGGKSQKTWEHSVPKIAKAGPRISLAFRHGMDSSVYLRKKALEPDRPLP